MCFGHLLQIDQKSVAMMFIFSAISKWIWTKFGTDNLGEPEMNIIFEKLKTVAMVMEKAAKSTGIP